MECLKCKGKTHKNGFEVGNGLQKYKCVDCGYNFNEGQTEPQVTEKPQVGMSLGEFKSKYDTDFIVNDRLGKVIRQLSKNMIYEKADIVKLAGLPASYPGFKDVLDSFHENQGRTNSKIFYSHSDTIAELKRQAKLT